MSVDPLDEDVAAILGFDVSAPAEAPAPPRRRRRWPLVATLAVAGVGAVGVAMLARPARSPARVEIAAPAPPPASVRMAVPAGEAAPAPPAAPRRKTTRAAPRKRRPAPAPEAETAPADTPPSSTDETNAATETIASVAPPDAARQDEAQRLQRTLDAIRDMREP